MALARNHLRAERDEKGWRSFFLPPSANEMELIRTDRSRQEMAHSALKNLLCGQWGLRHTCGCTTAACGIIKVVLYDAVAASRTAVLCVCVFGTMNASEYSTVVSTLLPALTRHTRVVTRPAAAGSGTRAVMTVKL